MEREATLLRILKRLKTVIPRAGRKQAPYDPDPDLRMAGFNVCLWIKTKERDTHEQQKIDTSHKTSVCVPCLAGVGSAANPPRKP